MTLTKGPRGDGKREGPSGTEPRERERESATKRSRNSTESAEHRMAEGMVGWIQLLGEQYCFAVIVCSSTCSGFPGLGPLASNPMSRYTTIFCLLAITPSTTTMKTRRRKRRTRTKTKMRTRMRTMMSIVEDCYSPRRLWHLRKSPQAFVLHR